LMRPWSLQTHISAAQQAASGLDEWLCVVGCQWASILVRALMYQHHF